MDYIKSNEIILDINKINFKDVMKNEELKGYYIEELDEYIYLKADLWNDYFKLFRFVDGEIYIYESEDDISDTLNNEDKITISSELIEIVKYKNNKILDELRIINFYIEFKLSSMDSNYSCKNNSNMKSPNKIVILDIFKERNHNTIMVAHDLYNNKILKLPSFIDGMKNRPEIGKAYICKFVIIINLNNANVKSKILRVQEELAQVDIYQYLEKYYDCCDYYYSDFNEVTKNSIKEDSYFLVRFSNSIVKKYREKYQLKLGKTFIDLDNSIYNGMQEIGEKLYRGIALIQASKMENGLIKYKAIRLLNKIRKIDDIIFNNKKQLNYLTASGLDIENFKNGYSLEQENSYNKCDDFDNDYDLGEDGITSTFIEYSEYDNEGEDFMLEYGDHDELNYDDFGNYASNRDSYHSDNSNFENDESNDIKNYQEIDFVGFIDIQYEKDYIRKKYNGRYYAINNISDPEFITNYEKIDVNKCNFSFNAYVRIQELTLKHKND